MLTDSIVSAETLSCNIAGPTWSNTSPPVDRGHIFCGKINSKGHATGYHHREGGVDPNRVHVRSITEMNSKTGVYVSQFVSVHNGDDWVLKRNKSSFFPDTCNTDQVVRSIAYAASHIECLYPTGKWSGMSSPPFDSGQYCRGVNDQPLVINGYWQSPSAEKVATAWPLVDGNNSKACLKQ